MAPDGTVTVLYSFGNPGIPDDPVYPDAGLVQATDGSFYGTSRAGGTANDGTVFKVTP